MVRIICAGFELIVTRVVEIKTKHNGRLKKDVKELDEGSWRG